MADTLEFIQNQNYEGVKITLTDDGAVLNISSLSTAVFRASTLDRNTLRFSGTWGSELSFLTDGTDGILIFTPDASDMSVAEVLRGEIEITLGGKKIKRQGLIMKIEPELPTS